MTSQFQSVTSQIQSWDHCIVEWLWASESIRINRPDQAEFIQPGSYTEVVQILTALGKEGWEVATCAGVANWLLWTLKRPINTSL